ncbi:MAG: NfeD family protein [Gammaproteobacteria bacterium]|nr:NfeD family protein [Gammaproteobacteria bacterium]
MEQWHWWVLALCLVVLEGMFPWGLFTGAAVAAGILGGLLAAEIVFPITTQLGMFAGITTLVSGPLYFVLRKNKEQTEKGALKAKKYVGQVFNLTVPVQNGFGEVEIDGHHWELKGPDMKIGTRVKVVGVDANMLVVLPINSRPTDPSRVTE